MNAIGLVSFGYHNKKECKKIAQRIRTISRRFQSSNHPVDFTLIEAAQYNLQNDKDRKKWSKIMHEQDGYVFIIPKDTESITDDITAALKEVSEEVKNKTLLLVYYGIENRFGENLDAVELARSLDMVVLYETVDLPYMDSSRATAFDKFESTEKETLKNIEKLLYWTMGMKYTRSLIRQGR